VPYTSSGAVSPSDIAGGRLSGTVIVDQNGQATISIPTTTHTGYQGNKLITVTVSGQSASETLIDTNAIYSLSANNSSFNQGTNATFTLNTTNVPVGTSIPYVITGSVASTDLAGGLFTGTTTVGANGVAAISIPTLSHLTFQGNKSITVAANGATATASLIDNAPAGSPDQYDGTYLSIPKVVSGGTTYSNIIVTVDKVISVKGGNPINAYDTYDGFSGQLTIPSVKVGSLTYTNVVVAVSASNIVSVNGTLLKAPAPSATNISLSSITPPAKTTGVSPTTDIKFTFSEYITPVGGNISLIDPNGKQQSLDVTANPLVQIAGNQLTLLHSDFYLASGTYQLLIPSGVIKGVSGGNYTGLNGYSINIVGLSTFNSGSGTDGGGGGGGGGGGF
jgi:hypothetical protein